jgi:tetratricopeptide (TPR) repeat protein
VPVNPGVFEIKPFTLIYFDVDKKDFQSVSTAPISLDVAPSETINLAAQPQNLKTNRTIIKKEVALVNKDILELKEGLKVLKNYKEINLLFFVLLLSIPAILFSGVKLFAIVLKKEISIEKQMQTKAKFHLKKAMKLHREDKDFLSHLNSSMVASVLAKGHKRGENITIQEVQTILKDAGIDIEKADQVTRLLEKIESIRFGGKILDENMAKDILSRTRQIIKTICIVLLCLGMFTLVHQPKKAMADSTAVFIDAIKDYKAGDFKKAGRKFENIAQNNIKNPYLYYNIGNSYLKASDIGHAVLWYERAKKIMPNDPDLNFNLDHANSLVKDKREDSIKIMEVIFFWDNLVSVKIIQITSVLSSFAFFTWAAIQVIRRKKIFSGFGIMVLSIFILFTSIVFVNYYKQAVKLNAVIVTKEAVIRSGMADTATQLFTLHAGTKIRVVEQKKGYLKIKFSKDKIGWVSTSQAAII